MNVELVWLFEHQAHIHLGRHPRAAVLRGFALGRSGLGRFIVGLDCPLFRAGRMGAGLKHQGDPACQKDHDDDSQE